MNTPNTGTVVESVPAGPHRGAQPSAEAPKKRGRKPGSVAKVRAELPPDAFRIESVAKDDRGVVRRKRVERSPQQKAIDAKAMEVYKEWIAAGSPTDWLKMPIKGWIIEKRLVDDALFFLGKGATLHGKKLRVGDILPAEGEPGKVRIPFCVTDRNERDEPASVEETAEAESAS